MDLFPHTILVNARSHALGAGRTLPPIGWEIFRKFLACVGRTPHPVVSTLGPLRRGLYAFAATFHCTLAASAGLCSMMSPWL